MELLHQTEDNKDLSTSTSTIEDPQDKMMRQAQGKNPTRQSTKSLSTISLEIVGGGGGKFSGCTGSGVMCPLSNVIFISVFG